MGIITDELREMHLRDRAQKCKDGAESLSIEERKQLKRVKERLDSIVNSLRAHAEGIFKRSGIVEMAGVTFYRSADEMVLLKSPQVVFEIEKKLREIEPNTVSVVARRRRYERAPRNGPETRPAMEIVAIFSPPLT